MFTKADAEAIRGGLGEPFDQQGPPAAADLFSRYFSFYGFESLDSFHTSTHCAGKLSVGSNQIVVQYFQGAANAAGTVFLLHGYFDHTGLYRHIIDYCLKRGFNVVIFDQIGHGLSTGEPASIDSFDSYDQVLRSVLQRAIEAELPQPWNIIGQSTGGAVIIDSLLKGYPEITDHVASYVLLAPLLRPFAWNKSKFLFAASKPFFPSTKRVFSQNSHDEEFLNFLKHDDPLQSRRLRRDWILAMINYQRDFAAAPTSSAALKVVQGTADTTVDGPYNTAQIQTKFPNAKVYLVEQARHQLVNESPLYRDQVFRLLDDFLISA